MGARILVTGFVAFGRHVLNPSEEAVRRLADALPGEAVVSTRVLPVTYHGAFEPVRDALDSGQFTAALLLGLGAGRAALDFERFAVNWRGTAQPDNEGVRMDGEPIDADGPAAYFATVPTEELVAAARGAGAPAAASSHAGTFICNQVLYQTLRHCDRRSLACRVGFVHLPSLPEQVEDEEPSLDLSRTVAGLRAALSRLASMPPPLIDSD